MKVYRTKKGYYFKMSRGRKKRISQKNFNKYKKKNLYGGASTPTKSTHSPDMTLERLREEFKYYQLTKLFEKQYNDCGTYRTGMETKCLDGYIPQNSSSPGFKKCVKEEPIKCDNNADFTFADLNGDTSQVKILEYFSIIEDENPIFVRGYEFSFCFMTIENKLIIAFPWGEDFNSGKYEESILGKYLEELIGKINNHLTGIEELHLYGHSMGSQFIIGLIPRLSKLEINLFQIKIRLSGIIMEFLNDFLTEPVTELDIIGINLGYRLTNSRHINRYHKLNKNYFDIYFLEYEQSQGAPTISKNDAAMGTGIKSLMYRHFHDFLSIIITLQGNTPENIKTSLLNLSQPVEDNEDNEDF